MQIEVGAKYRFFFMPTTGPSPKDEVSAWRAGYLAHSGHTVTVKYEIEGPRHRSEPLYYIISEDGRWKGAAFAGELERIT